MNRSPRSGDETDRWREVLIGYLTGREEGFVEDGRLVPGGGVQSETAVVRALAVT